MTTPLSDERIAEMREFWDGHEDGDTSDDRAVWRFVHHASLDLLEEVERLRGIVQWREARASVALDGETMHVAAAGGSCCWRHAMAKIAELEAALEEIEWRDIGNSQEVCAYCDSWRSDGHHFTCVLGKALRREECE